MNDPILTHSGGQRRWLVHHNKKRRCALLAALAYVACSLALAGAAHFFVGGIGSRAEAATDVTSYAAETSTISPSGYASPFNDSAALGGQTLGMWRNSSVSKTLALSKPADELVIRARGSLCNGAPRMQVSVGGTEIINTLVSSTTYTNFSKTGLSLSGSQAIKVSFTNDYYVNSNCDRNLYVDHVSLRSNSSSSPPPPPPPSGTLIWSETFDWDFHSGGMSGTTGGMNSTLSANWSNGSAAASDRITEDATIKRGGISSAKYTVLNGDRSPYTYSNNPRAQLERHVIWQNNTAGYLGWSMYFPTSYPNLGSGDWAIHSSIGECQDSGGGWNNTTLHMAVDNALSGNRIRWEATNGVVYQETMQRGAWIDWTFRFNWSKISSTGYVEIWRNGQKLTLRNGTDRWYFASMDPGCSSAGLKASSYRIYDTSMPSVTMYHDEIKYGDTYSIVQPG
jgi:hypothetical protein